MFKAVKKIFSKNPDEQKNKTTLINKAQQKAEGFIDFIQNKIQETKNEFGDIRAKMSNLLETNYNLGLKHLEKGNISDAVFRFRFIKKFWPECFDAYYQLAYALALNKKPYEAKKVLTELLIKKPDYDIKARELFDKIKRGEV